MREYLLDTHIIVWLLTGDPRLEGRLRDDILYYQHQYHVSQLSLLEMLHLQQLGRIALKKTAAEVQDTFLALNVAVDLASPRTFKTLEKIPMVAINGARHSDMVDRYLIADAITHRETLVSADLKFPHYRKYGLTLLEA